MGHGDSVWITEVLTTQQITHQAQQVLLCTATTGLPQSCHQQAGGSYRSLQDPAVQYWPTLTNVKQVRGFLGFTVYYRKFIKDYSLISLTLSDLLKKTLFFIGMTWSSKPLIT
jgi:hypothetical protein